MLIHKSTFTSFGCQIKRENYWIMRCRIFAKTNKPLLQVLSQLRRQAGEHGCLYTISEVANTARWFKNTNQSEDFTIRSAGQGVQYN